VKENYLRAHRIAATCTRFLLHRPFLASTWRVRADCVAEEEGHAGTARAACPHTGPPTHAPFHTHTWNPCVPPSIPLKHETLNMKQMHYTSKTTETFETCTCNICMKHMQHVDKTFATYI
jgi:hypothetical protein